MELILSIFKVYAWVRVCVCFLPFYFILFNIMALNEALGDFNEISMRDFLENLWIQWANACAFAARHYIRSNFHYFGTFG